MKVKHFMSGPDYAAQGAPQAAPMPPTTPDPMQDAAPPAPMPSPGADLAAPAPTPMAAAAPGPKFGSPEWRAKHMKKGKKHG